MGGRYENVHQKIVRGFPYCRKTGGVPYETKRWFHHENGKWRVFALRSTSNTPSTWDNKTTWYFQQSNWYGLWQDSFEVTVRDVDGPSDKFGVYCQSEEERLKSQELAFRAVLEGGTDSQI